MIKSCVLLLYLNRDGKNMAGDFQALVFNYRIRFLTHTFTIVKD